jgi:hypothetical protein
VRHSFYTPRLSQVDRELRDRHGAVPLYESDSMVVPVFTDTMMDPQKQNRVQATVYRFVPQFFSSIVYQIPKQTKPDGDSGN